MTKEELNINKVSWLALGIALASLPHWPRLAIWIPLLHVSLLLMRIIIPLRFPLFWANEKTTINIIRLIVMFGGVFAIYGSFGTLAGRDVGIALLVMLAALKIFESKAKRDFYICSYLGYFLIITNFFYSQTIPTAFYMFVVIIIMTAGLINFNDTEAQLSVIGRFKLSTSLLVQSLPILLILFLLFPRVNGPLWGLPKDAHTGITGINDQMSPGTISKLVQSKEVAFRVTFENEIPDQSKLYWRGPVLWQTDGRKWTVGQANTSKHPSPVSFSGEVIDYELTIEPTNKRWLFGLEMSKETPADSYLTHDRQLKTKKSIHSRKAYKLSSYSNYFFGKKEADSFERALRLPEISHPQTKDFGLSLRDQYQQPRLIVDAALAWLKKESFIYTLQPPLMTQDMVDEFLFETRQGFCEHDASAFTVLMRAAGIPARVVTGYLGGEINPVGNYLIVRQYHAHAWTEVWLDNEGWTRIDPTSVVSPSRITEGMESALPEAIIDIPLGLSNNATATRLWQRLRNTVDMVNYQWAQWILGYGPDKQKLFLQKLGFQEIDWKELTMMLLTILGIIVAAIAATIFKRTARSSDPAKLSYDIFCTKLAKIGLPKEPYEGPVDYAQRISLTRKDLGKDIQLITDLYIDTRYRSINDTLLKLKRTIRSFKPAKRILI